MTLRFTLNDRSVTFAGDDQMPLLWYLRDHAKLLGTRFGCGVGACGACTVHVDGRAVRSCSMPLAAVSGKGVTTIEHLASTATGQTNDERLHPVQEAWLEEDVPQCGYCQAGQIMAAVDFLQRFPSPTDADIDEHHTNLCRCGTYPRIRKAIKRAAAKLQEREA